MVEAKLKGGLKSQTKQHWSTAFRGPVNDHVNSGVVLLLEGP